MPLLKVCLGLVTCLLAAFLHANAQTKRIAALKDQIVIAGSLDEKAKAIFNLCADKYSLHGDTMYHYAREAAQIANQLGNTTYQHWANYYTGYSYLTTGILDSSIAIADRYLTQATFYDHKDLYSQFSILKEMACYKGNKPRECMKIMYELQQFTKADSSSIYNIETNNMIGLAYSAINQYPESIKWTIASSNINSKPYQSRLFTEQKARSYMAFSISYMHIFESRKQNIYIDSSIYFARIADTLCKQNEILFFYCQSQILQGYYYSYKKQSDSAEYFLNEGLRIRKFLGDPVYIASDLSVLGTFYSTIQQPQKGIAVCKEGIALAEKYQLTSQLYVLLYNALAQNYEVAGDYKNYGSTLRHLIALRDSISGKSAAEEIQKLQASYEQQQNEMTIARQKLDITKKNYQFTVLLVLSVLAACIAIVIFLYYKKKQQLRLLFIREEEKRLAEASVKDAEEKQRRRIAAELHDNIGAQVSFINSNIDWIMDSPVPLTYEEQKERLAIVHDTSKDLMRNIRETLWALNREEITFDELADKLKMYMQTIARLRPGTIFYSEEKISASIILHPIQALNIFRIMQEAVSNILKHSNATELTLRLSCTNKQFMLSLNDNGVGFNNQQTEGEHYGIKNMHHRAIEADIQLLVQSQPGKGTTISIESHLN